MIWVECPNCQQPLGFADAQPHLAGWHIRENGIFPSGYAFSTKCHKCGRQAAGKTAVLIPSPHEEVIPVTRRASPA